MTIMTIQAHCDNQAVVEIINQRSSKDQGAMHLRFAEARFGCFIIAKHISEVHNTLADALSRDSLPLISHQHRNVYLTGLPHQTIKYLSAVGTPFANFLWVPGSAHCRYAHMPRLEQVLAKSSQVHQVILWRVWDQSSTNTTIL